METLLTTTEVRISGWHPPHQLGSEALKLQIWSVERLHDQQCPLPQMETLLTTIEVRTFRMASTTPYGF
jgi:hypothetical protein